MKKEQMYADEILWAIKSKPIELSKVELELIVFGALFVGVAYGLIIKFY